MRGNLPAQEPQRLARWDQLDLYGRIRERRRGARKFILHDGPPYANGEIHIGHALNKVLKDIIVRYKTMRGYDAPYVPGWDCHGLPIEHQLLREMGKRKEEVPGPEFRRQARGYAQKYVGAQRDGFRRLGVLGDWARPYLTMDPEYQAAIAECFFLLYAQGFIERRLKPVPWCPECETALADAELEYEDDTSPSIYVAFPLDTGPISRQLPEVYEGSQLVIWTTTPWTLPANRAIAINIAEDYVLFGDAHGSRKYIVAQKLSERFVKDCKLHGKVLDRRSGLDFEQTFAHHPWIEGLTVPVLSGNFVAMDTGTGLVHIAPGHGEDDHQLGVLHKLDVYSPIDDHGCFTEDVPEWKGQNVFKADPLIIEHLKKKGTLLHQEEITHSYPHCWRCKQPIIFRATPQWFLDVDHRQLRQRVLRAIEETIRFTPAWGKRRIGAMMATRPDWCLSRQRSWGVPIPVVTCEQCGTVYAEQLRDRVVRAFREQGADVWFERSAQEWVGTAPRCCAAPRLRKEEDILDVWFDSGASHHAVLVPRQHADLTFPADLYLEGSDQHRGWFQTSLLVAMGVHGTSPFTGVLTHGFVVDGEGRKMSKSLGNVIAPQEVLACSGADILRLWVAGCDYAEDIRLSATILEQTAELYRKIRNTMRYLIGNLWDFDPSSDQLPREALTPVDRWAVARAATVVREATACYDAYAFHQVVKLVSRFCTVDLSNFYLDVLKDRLYTCSPPSPARRSAQTALWHCWEALVTVMAPILPFTTDEAWEALGRHRETPSVHLAAWPAWAGEPEDPAWEPRWACFFRVRDAALKALEVQRAAGVIGDPGEAEVTVTIAEPAQWAALEPLRPSLAELLLVSSVEARQAEAADPIQVQARRCSGVKCARCWRYTQDVGHSAEHPGLCARCVEVLATNEQVSR